MMKEQTNSLNQKYIKAKGQAKQEISITDITVRIDIDQMVEIGESNLMVEFSMEKITEVDQGMEKAIGKTLGEEILEAIWGDMKIRILEDRIIEVDIEEIIGMRIMKEEGLCLEKGLIQVTSEGMTEVIVTVGQGQDQK